MTEEEFLDCFELPDIDDQEEKGRRRRALKQYQDEVKEIHKKFANGEKDWDAGIYEFSNLPDEDFVTTHTGLLDLYPSYRTRRSFVTWNTFVCQDNPKKDCNEKNSLYGCEGFTRWRDKEDYLENGGALRDWDRKGSVLGLFSSS